MTRIHVLGASGAGTTTLGVALAAATGARHVDSDDIYWIPSDPPFAMARPLEERRCLLMNRLPADGAWVFSGSAMKWGEPAEPLYQLVVFLTVDPKLRMERIVQREHERYGARIAPGGDMHQTSRAFLNWARAYDTAGPEQRSRASHEAWLAGGQWPILRLDSARPVEHLVEDVKTAAAAL